MKTIEEQAREYAEDIETYMSVWDGPKPSFEVLIEKAFLEGAKSDTRWIPVEEEFPELYVPVLVAVIKPELKEDDVQRGVCAYLGHGIWINQFGTVDEAPTHWLPIPPIPEK